MAYFKLLILLLLIPLTSLAGSHPLLNDRDGENSALIGKFERKYLLNLKVDSTLLTNFFNTSISEYKLGDACSVTLLDRLVKTQNEDLDFVDLAYLAKDDLFKLLRMNKIIDEVLLDILLKTSKLQDKLGSDEELVDEEETTTPEVTTNPTTPVERDRNLKFFEDYIKRKKAKKCTTDNIKQLSSDLRGKDTKNFNFKKTLLSKLRDAKVKKEIPVEVRNELKVLAKLKVEAWPLSLQDYITKKNSLRAQYPLIRVDERSDFVTKVANKKQHLSYRRRLLEQYSYFQIILMGNVIKKLKERMDSNHIDILVYKRDEQLLETIPLDPMERYRFSVKILQKEMKELAANTYFEGKSASYIDLITAAYEIGIVTGIEVDEVAKLEEIWNPKKTLFEKAWVWIKMVGNVASILIPPPFGFIPSLAIVAIEAATKKPEKEEGHSLF